MNISEFIEKRFPKEAILSGIKNEDLERSNWYYENSKADAVYGMYCIAKYLNKNIKILEVGGGLHFLSTFFKSKRFYCRFTRARWI